MNEEKKIWQYFKWFCPNCGELVYGYKNVNDKVKVKCRKCACDQILTPMQKEGSSIIIFPPNNFSNI